MHPRRNAMRFGPFELRLPAGDLFRNGDPVRLQDLPRRLLVFLCERPGEVVTRDELGRYLWADEQCIDCEHGLNTAIKKVREALDDSPADPRFIETVPRQGYRFIGTTAAGVTHRWPRWRHRAAALLAIVAVSIAAGVVRGRDTLRSITAIAVLPLENVSGDARQDYLADGMTDALITDLGQLPGMTVISRTSVMPYKHARKPSAQIARDLGVDAFVEGSVMRSGDRVRIATRLVEATTQRQLWSDMREREVGDAMAMQDEIARALARRIEATVSSPPRTPPHFNLEAEEAYLEGRDASDDYTSGRFTAAVAYFQEAIRLEPEDARAWAGLAHAKLIGIYTRISAVADGLPAAETSGRRALELDPNLSEAHVVAGELHCIRYDWRLCEDEYRRAIALNGSNADAHQLLGYYLAGVVGDFPDGIAEMRRAATLDPLSLSKKNSLAAALFWAKRYGEAVQILRDIPDSDRNASRRHQRLLMIFDRRNMQADALREMSALAMLAHRPELAASVVDIAQRAGYVAARGAFGLGMADVPDIAAAFYLSMAGDNDRALTTLEALVAANAYMPPTFLGVDPLFDPLRSDPRFDRVLERVALDRCSVSVGRRAAAGDCG